MSATSCQQGAYTRDDYIGLKGQTPVGVGPTRQDRGLWAKGRNRRHIVDYQPLKVQHLAQHLCNRGATFCRFLCPSHFDELFGSPPSQSLRTAGRGKGGCVFREGMCFVSGAVLKNSGSKLQDGRNRWHLKPCWNAKPAGGLREMLAKHVWSLISVLVNEHRRKAPTWGPPRIPECM